MDRRGLLRQHIDLATARILEIGALAAPLVRPDEGRVEYVDHLDTEGLREEYAGHPNVDPDALVEVTHVWSDGTLAEAIGETGAFDAIISSHVFEHLPNPIRWLLDAYDLLTPDGQVFMVVPDMRFTFDRRRPRTRVGDWIEWYLTAPTRPTPAQVFDYHAASVEVPAGIGWQAPPEGGFAPVHDIAAAMELARATAEDGRYVDTHCSVFTPASLLGMLAEIDRLNLFPFDVAAVYPTAPHDIEFALVLTRNEAAARPRPNREKSQALARQAGYAGEFGAGRYAAALSGDEDLRQRVRGLEAQWIAEVTRARGAGTRLPILDPALHDAWPAADDPRLTGTDAGPAAETGGMS